MSKQPTQRQADDIGIACGMQRKPNEFSVPGRGQGRVLVKMNNVLFVCKPEPGGWRCGYCGKGRLGLNPKEGKKCRVCWAVVVLTGR